MTRMTSKPHSTSWWLNHPSEKYARQIWIISPGIGVEINKKCLKPPPGPLRGGPPHHNSGDSIKTLLVIGKPHASLVMFWTDSNVGFSPRNSVPKIQLLDRRWFNKNGTNYI